MANPITTKDKNTIIIRDKKGIVSQLLDSEFKSGVFLEREKLIKEFVNDLKDMKEDLLTDYFDSFIEKWEKKLQ